MTASTLWVFERDDIEEMLDTLEDNYLGWAGSLAPAIMGAPERPELGQKLANSFCRTGPDIAAHFARVIFLADHRTIPHPRTVRASLCTRDYLP